MPGSLNRLESVSPLDDDLGRGQLNESLDLIDLAIKRLRDRLDAVEAADRVVQAVPIEAFPLGTQPFVDELGIGTIVFVPDLDMRGGGDDPPEGYLWCDGSGVSTTTYADLFAVIGYDYGGAGATFNLPDARSRSIIGASDVGTNAQPNRAPADTGGVDAVTLTSNELPSHSHDMNSHTHTIAHTHDRGSHFHNMAHTHGVPHEGSGSGGSLAGMSPVSPNFTGVNHTGYTDGDSTNQPSTSVTATDGSGNTGAASTSTSGGPSTGSTQATGSGNAVTTHSPFIAMSVGIKFKNFSNSAQPVTTLSWGPVSGHWTLGGRAVFPDPEIDNTWSNIADQEHPEPVLKVTSASGASASYTQTVDLVVRLPYNWRSWKTRAVRLRTYCAFTGAGGNSFTVRLKVYNPLSLGNFLSPTYTRTVNADGGGLAADPSFQPVDAYLTKEDLGPTWKPGYALKLRLEVVTPASWGTADIRLGRLEIGWR